VEVFSLLSNLTGSEQNLVIYFFGLGIDSWERCRNKIRRM